VDRYPPNRREFLHFEQVLRHLAPRPVTTLLLEDEATRVVRQVVVTSQTREHRRISDLTRTDGGRDIWDLIRQEQNWEHDRRGSFVTVGDRVLVWRMPTFVLDDEQIDDAFSRARRLPALIIDLRGNSGGDVTALERVVGYLVPRDVVLDTLHERQRIVVDTVRARHDAFAGDLIVLIDQGSASASELLARTVQLQRRGVVIGDASAGAVMMSRYYGEQAGGQLAVLYTVQITVSDVVMPDGGDLEHVGVQPDERVLPTGLDLATGRDPVLARALQRLGYTTSPEAAGRMFGPRPWGMW
jgi:C-terminal processing protease CtpA/Prc